MQKLFITGTAGFIGFHLSQHLLKRGYHIHGFDGITPYYDQRLKRDRHQILLGDPKFSASEALLEDERTLHAAIQAFQPDAVIHLAAQAGVRYSLENPRAYIDANMIGTFNILEAVRKIGIGHFMMASTSSVYGAKSKLPFVESEATIQPLTLYAATKIAAEAMAHSYASLWNIPTTAFRFFSVYGSWGRPDMALFKFTEAILNNRAIDLYNNGQMTRDFTFVADLVTAIALLVDKAPGNDHGAPFQTVNIGNAHPVSLLEFVAELEKSLGKYALRNLMPMQPGDVSDTWADISKLVRLTGYTPATPLALGITDFVDWYRGYYASDVRKTGT